MSDEAYANAVVTVTVKIESRGHWGKDATIEEVRRIGGREALQELKGALDTINAEIVGTPTIGIVTWSRK